MVDGPNLAPGGSPTEPSTGERFILILWRRKWVLALTFVVITTATAVIAKSLPPVYSATSTLWVTEDRGTAALDAAQAGELLARTYADVADSPILAAQVTNVLPFRMSVGDVLGAMEFEPVAETQLLKITAEDRDPGRARILANTYASEFIAYSEARLGDTARSKIAVADRASTPTQPERPKPTAYTLVAAMFALLAGIGLALLFDVLDRRVRSTEELERLLPVPALAHVPSNEGSSASQSAFEETFRLLRTNLQFIRRGGDPLRSLSVVSPSEGDGKSSVSYYLARSLAASGHRVVLVEGDMRRPGLQKRVLGANRQRVAGLSTFLSSGTPSLDGLIYETRHPDLLFVPAGLLPPSPSTLLDAGSAKALIDALSEVASMVIIDTPPLSVGAEASTLAASSDGALMVVDLRRSNKVAIKSARRQLEVVGANLLGVVLNRVRDLPDMGGYAYRHPDVSDQSEAAPVAAADATPAASGRRRKGGEPNAASKSPPRAGDAKRRR